MKKILSILLCAAMLLTLLAGCGGGEAGTDPTETTKHKHTYATDWSSDETNHWYQATCEHSTLQANFGEHLDDNLDGICDVCAYVSKTCDHTYSEAWTSDAEFHWHSATCTHVGSVSEKAAHADENNDGACDVCAYMGEHTHSFQESWSYDNTQHWLAATCGHDVDDKREDHADQNNDGVCDTCGWFDETHTHTFATEWKTDVTYHWHAATCEHLGAVSEQEQHVDADENGYCDTCQYLMCTHVDYDLDGECDTCGWTDPEHTHEFGTEVGCDVGGHWFVATCHPGAVSEKEEHADSDNNGVCDICAFQICGHSYAATWTTNDTHHWHAILCTCSIERKDYATHVDEDGDGGCDVCMFGLPVPSVYEVIVNNQPFTLVLDKMISYTPFTVNFPQPGRYIITPGNEQVRVWMTDGSDANSDNGFYNSGSTLTIDVEEAGEMTLWFRYFDMDYKNKQTLDMTYSVVRSDELVIETVQGKVELPANTIYTAKFIAKEIGTYKLITGVDGLVIGLTEASMEYYKGHIELVVTEVGQEFTLWLEYRDPTVNSFIFDWRLEEPFCLSVGEGTYAVDVGPTQVDYKIEFTAPEAGYYLLKVYNKWMTFAQMGDVYTTPVRMETMEVLTHYMQPGEVYTIWLQTVYDYPEATRLYDTLTISNVGEKLSVSSNTVAPGAEGSRYCFQATGSSYYRITVTGGELGVIASNGNVSWITDAYEVELAKDQTYSFMLRGAGNVTVNVTPVSYAMELLNGENSITMEPNRYYTTTFLYTFVNEKGDTITEPMNSNSTIALSWEGNLIVMVNGVEYSQGASIALLNTEVKILVKSNGPADVKINVTVLDDANIRDHVEGSSNAELILHQLTQVAVNRDGVGAYAYFTAEVGGTYTLTSDSELAVIYIENADGTRTQVLVGADSYSFTLNVGQYIKFYIQTSDESMATVGLTLTPGN